MSKGNLAIPIIELMSIQHTYKELKVLVHYGIFVTEFIIIVMKCIYLQ